ncbi:MAG TPA: protein-disulfide reductase DsbD domain-containing protein, partial [Stellaceae bacterium]|nr:protein-disulfide reductase DsbD domain-containing protein [Stellaceae bacterium]
MGAARAADGASPWFETDQGRVRLVAAAPRVGDGDSIELGLDFRLAPHWKIYWRSPGDAGYPPRLDWSGSTNLAATAMAWPAPERFSVLGLDTIGYTDAVVLPITAKL